MSMTDAPVPSRYRTKRPRGLPLAVKTTNIAGQSYAVVSPSGDKLGGNCVSNLPSPAHSTHDEFSVTIQLPSQKVIRQVSSTTTVGDLLRSVCSEHRYEVSHDASESMLWEVVNLPSQLSGSRHRAVVSRPLRSDEFVKQVWLSWGSLAQAKDCNYLEIRDVELQLDDSSLASVVPRRDIVKECPKVALAAQWGNKSHWRESMLQIRNGTATVYVGSSVARTIHLSEFDLYEGLKGPAEFTLTLKSPYAPENFEDPAKDSMHHLSFSHPDDYDTLRNICFSLRSGAAERMTRQFAMSLSRATSPVTPAAHGAPLISDLASPTTPYGIEAYAMSARSLEHDRQPFAKDGLIARAASLTHTTQISPAQLSPVLPIQPLSGNVFKPNSLLDRASAKPRLQGRGLVGAIPMANHSMAIQHQLR